MSLLHVEKENKIPVDFNLLSLSYIDPNYTQSQISISERLKGLTPVPIGSENKVPKINLDRLLSHSVTGKYIVDDESLILNFCDACSVF